MRPQPQIGYLAETKEGGMMVITTTRVTQMHDMVKTLQHGPEGVKEFICSEGPWLGEELEKAWENHYEVQGYSPFATCGNDQCRNKDLCVLTSAALPSISPSSPLHAPFAPSTLGSQVPGVDSPCSPLHQVRGGISPSRGNASSPQVEAMQGRHGPVCLKRLLSRTDQSLRYNVVYWKKPKGRSKIISNATNP